MASILVTGGAGFIPSCLAEKLAENPENKLVLIDNFVTGFKKKINLILFFIMRLWLECLEP